MATISACGEDSNGEESDLSKVLASQRMNTDDFDSINLASQQMNTDGWGSIDPVLTGLGAGSRKSYHQPIFTLVPSAHCLLMLLLNQATLDSTATAGTATQDFRSHASSGAQAQASTSAQTQAPVTTQAQGSAAENFGPHASLGAQTQASTSAQPQAPVAATQAPVATAQAEAPSTNKRPKERTAAPPDPGFDPMMDGELTPQASPAPKRSKQEATKGADKPKPVPASGPKLGIRKRKKH